MDKKINKDTLRDMWENFPKKMNIKQKIILAIFVPILLFFITYTIAYYVSVERIVIIPEKTIIRTIDLLEQGTVLCLTVIFQE